MKPLGYFLVAIALLFAFWGAWAEVVDPWIGDRFLPFCALEFFVFLRFGSVVLDDAK